MTRPPAPGLPGAGVADADASAAGPAGLDRWLPAWHFRERHATRVDAPPDAVARALREVTVGEVRFLRGLMALRALPAVLAGRPRRWDGAGTPVLEAALRGGFVLLADEPGRELVAGVIGRFWRPVGNLAVVLDGPEGFARFAEPGYARAAIGFRLERGPGGAVRLETETRISTPEPGVRRRFGLYWRIILPGSALLRREWLAAIKRRAERGSAGGMAVSFVLGALLHFLLLPGS